MKRNAPVYGAEHHRIVLSTMPVSNRRPSQNGRHVYSARGMNSGRAIRTPRIGAQDEAGGRWVRKCLERTTLSILKMSRLLIFKGPFESDAMAQRTMC